MTLFYIVLVVALLFWARHLHRKWVEKRTEIELELRKARAELMEGLFPPAGPESKRPSSEVPPSTDGGK